MTWNRPHVVLILSSTSLLVIQPKKSLHALLPFDPSLCQYGEVLDVEKFAQSLENFFQEMDVTGAGVLFLADDVVFSAPITDGQDVNQDIEKQKFLQLLPIESAHAAVLTNPATLPERFFFATNASFFSQVLRSAAAHHLEVSAVVPLQFLGLTPPDGEEALNEFGAELLRTYKKKLHPSFALSFTPSEKVEKVAASSSAESEVSISSPKAPRPNRTVALLALIVIFLEILLVILLFRSSSIVSRLSTRYEPLPPPQDQVSNTATSAAAESSNAATQQPLAELLKTTRITVINASGKSGQAKKLQTLLQDKGYTQVTTGNAALATESGVIVKHTATVSAEVVKNVGDAVGSTQTKIEKNLTTEVVVQIGP